MTRAAGISLRLLMMRVRSRRRFHLPLSLDFTDEVID
jgi:hypothetical protein